MYIGFLHYFASFIYVIVFVLLILVIIYKYKTPKEIATFGFVGLTLVVILWFSTIMWIDSSFKSATIKNINTIRSYRGETLKFSADIYNDGKMPLKSCELTASVINLKPQKVSGAIFGFDKVFNIFNNEPQTQNRYNYIHKINLTINPGYSKKVVFNMKLPSYFVEYKTTARVSCK